jgi:hypothetical protein
MRFSNYNEAAFAGWEVNDESERNLTVCDNREETISPCMQQAEHCGKVF